MQDLNWMETRSGKRVSLVDPQPEDIILEDIAEALGNLCRFTGHTKRFYSVAEHSLLVAHMAADRALPKETQLKFLMHDFHEAYIGDVSTPVTRLLASLAGKDLLADLKTKFDLAIGKKFGVVLDTEYDVYDKALGYKEKQYFLPDGPSWDFMQPPTLYVPDKYFLQVKQPKEELLACFLELKRYNTSKG